MADPEMTEATLNALHPLAVDALAVFDKSGADPKFQFTNGHMADLRQGLEALFETEPLRDAVRSLLGIAHGFQQQGIEHPARQLFDLLAEPGLLEALDRVNATLESESREAVADSSKKFKDFQDRAAPSAAPKVGEERPEGTLSLDKLRFPKRL